MKLLCFFTEIPSRQSRPSGVTNHTDYHTSSDNELQKTTEKTVKATDPGNNDRTSPAANNGTPGTAGQGEPLEFTPDIIVLCDQQRNKIKEDENVLTTKTDCLKQNLAKSLSDENKMASVFTPLSRKCALSVTTTQTQKTNNNDSSSGYHVVSAQRVNVEDNNSDGSSIYEQFEISGDRHDMRFPWQHDVPVQCDRVETREVSIQTDFGSCSECRLRRLSDASALSELDSASNYGFNMALKRGSAPSSTRQLPGRGKRLQRQNFSLDLSDYPGSTNGGLMVNGAASGSPTAPFRSRSSRLTASRPLSDSDMSRSSMEGLFGQSKIFQRRKGTIDVAKSRSGITLTIDRYDTDSLPCSPLPSPIPQVRHFFISLAYY